MQNYRRHLPHWQPEGAEFFVTWRLHGSLPAGHTGADFVTVDRELERSIGPRWMQDPRVANCVMETLIESEQTWKLWAWIVMPNHVHALLHPVQKLSKVMLVIKSASARRANRLLERARHHMIAFLADAAKSIRLENSSQCLVGGRTKLWHPPAVPTRRLAAC
jgi:hypothetical protein